MEFSLEIRERKKTHLQWVILNIGTNFTLKQTNRHSNLCLVQYSRLCEILPNLGSLFSSNSSDFRIFKSIVLCHRHI